MIKLLLVLFFTSVELHASVEFYSPFVKKAEFTIDNSVVNSNRLETPIVTIKNQLKYLFGSFNEVDSGIDFESLNIKITNSRQTGNGYEYSYSANGLIAWDSKRILPEKMLIYLPKYGDIEKLQLFVERYQKDCAKKSANVDSFWNYYRPSRNTCPIAKSDNDDIIKVHAQLRMASSAIQRNFNYNEISKDGIIELTAIFTKDKPIDANDISIADFKKICLEFSKQATSYENSENECHAIFLLKNQQFKTHVFLVNNFDVEPKAFLGSIEKYTLTSDIVTFNGHSGMGANVRSFINHYVIPPSKYQIIFFNSCDTFSYFGETFFNKVKIANDSVSSTEWLDVILTATPNYFGTFATTNINLLNSLSIKSSITEALLKTPPEQHSLIYFEK